VAVAVAVVVVVAPSGLDAVADVVSQVADTTAGEGFLDQSQSRSLIRQCRSTREIPRVGPVQGGDGCRRVSVRVVGRCDMDEELAIEGGPVI
jgi:hypothetical protein